MKMSPKGKRGKAKAVPPEEQLARYAYLLKTVPGGIAEKAHTSAFADLSDAQRAALLDQLRPLAPGAEGEASSGEPDLLARMVREAEPREAMLRSSVGPTVATSFTSSEAVVGYFTSGAGSVSIDAQPPWVSDLVGHDAAPVDGGTVNHFKGVNSGVWY
jgi:hypothetical protein